MAYFFHRVINNFMIQTGDPKEMVLVVNPSGRAKTNPKIQVPVLRMSILHTFTTFVEP